MTEILVNHVVNWIGVSGYSGLVVLMALESMVAPLPSEAVMPFAGFLIYEGTFSFTGVIFFNRFVPVVRHLISIPAGAGEMKAGKFTLYTAVGAGLWNSLLAYAGFRLKSHREEIRRYGQTIDWVVAAVPLAGLAYFIYRHVRRLKATKVS